MAGPLLADTPEDVEEFIDKVDEVHRLIEGLKAGTLSPEYIDSKQKYKAEKEREKLALEQKCPAGRGPPQPTSASTSSSDKDVENEQDTEAERRDRAMEKVKDLMANRERKLRARAHYEEYVRSQGKTQFGTDYTKWDIWCPEDEEDDLINSIGPNTPQFRAMEKDIDERHRQMVERRQLAERCRVAGNTAYGARQYSEALRCYQQGIESERTNMALHANAAMAALKMSCFVQAVEHCDKVLSIAEFFHNNKNHPLCVKALQRRAEAFRALQQPGRAVQDLEAALVLEPGNAEAAKQLSRARQEEEEARKQRAIAKAVSKAASGSGSMPSGTATGSAGDDGGSKAGGAGRSVVEVGSLALDLEKLGRLERLAAALATSSSSPTDGEVVESAGTEVGGLPAAGKGSTGGKDTNGAGPRRGPVLPPRARGGTTAVENADGKAKDTASGDSNGSSTTATAVEGGVVAVCRQLRELLAGDDSCCVYLRECGGLAHAAARISKCPTGDSATQDIVALLLLLNDACMNDGNLRQLLSLRVLPSVIAALDGAGADAAAAAASLLCTAVTMEDVRREVSRLLGGGNGKEAQLPRLVRLLAGAKPAVQGVALALLGNCMLDKPTKTAMAALWHEDAAAATCFLSLLRSPTPVLAEKAAVLLGNMAIDPALRTEILARAQDGVVRQLLALAMHETGSPAGLQLQQQEMRRAATTALFNLTVEERGQQLVAADAEGLAKLYGMATSRKQDGLMAARAAGVCARAGKVGAGAAVLLRQGAISGMLGVVTAALDEVAGSDGTAPESGATSQGGSADADADSGDHTATLLDAAVRTLTVLTASDDCNLAAQLVAAGGISVLLRVVRAASGGTTSTTAGPSASPASAASGAGALGESVLANAALCVAGLARYREHLSALRAADPVPLLLGVAYRGRGNTPSKNAAIALARLAHEPAMLEQLRELHGIEIIYQYVKP